MFGFAWGPANRVETPHRRPRTAAWVPLRPGATERTASVRPYLDLAPSVGDEIRRADCTGAGGSILVSTGGRQELSADPSLGAHSALHWRSHTKQQKPPRRIKSLQEELDPS